MPDATRDIAPNAAHTTPAANVDVLIVTLNEQLNLPHALESVRDWTNRVFVVDSGSTDRTCAIAASHGAHVEYHAWEGYAAQKNWALSQLPWESDWILILDADECAELDLRDAVQRITARPVDQVPEAAFFVNRYFLFLGKRLRHCGYYPSWNVRLMKRGRARCEDRQVHERMVVDGPVGYLDGHLAHWDRRGVGRWMDKHNQYARLEALEIHRAQRDGASGHVTPRLFGDWEQRRRWIKQRLYPRLPMRWLLRFGYMYIWRLGFLDGLTGLRFCLFVSAYELMITLHQIELNRGRVGSDGDSDSDAAQPARETHAAPASATTTHRT